VSETPTPTAEPEEETTRSALESLARAARQAALYGPAHPIAAESLQEAWRQICAQAAGGMVRLGVTPQGLSWNGRPVVDEAGHTKRLYAALRERFVSSVRFFAGLRLADLTQFLVVLSEDPKLLAASGGVTRALAEVVGPGLVVEDMNFHATVGDGEALWLQTCHNLDPEAARPLRQVLESCLQAVRSAGDTKVLDQIRAALSVQGGDVTQDASSMEAVAATTALLIQYAGEVAARAGEEAREQWEQATVEQLEALGPAWNAHIFRAPIGPDRATDVLAGLARRMETSQCVAMVLEYPGAIASERSEGLTRILKRVMSDPLRMPEIAHLLREEAIRAGIPEEVYRNVVGLVMPQVAPTGGEPGIEPADIPSAEGGPREELADLLEMIRPATTRRSYADSLLGMLELELNASQYGTLMRALLALIGICAEEDDTELLVGMMERLHQEVTEERSPGRRAMATSAMTRSGDPEVVRYIIDELRRSPAERQERLLGLLAYLGEEGMRALCWLAGRTADVISKPALVALAQRDGPAYMNLRRLLADLPVRDLEHVLRVLVGLNDREVRVQLSAVTDRPEAEAKTALIEVVREAGRGAPAEPLVRLLADPEPEVRVAAAEALGAVRAVEAVPSLCYLLGREPDRGLGGQVKAAAARALGEIGAPDAVPGLAELLHGGGLLSGWSLEPARLAAAGALAHIGTAEARRALEQWRLCRHPRVQEACRQALAGGEDGVS
jgi:hypothetical protein